MCPTVRHRLWPTTQRSGEHPERARLPALRSGRSLSDPLALVRPFGGVGQRNDVDEDEGRSLRLEDGWS